jgi:hypothetical protein
MERLLAKPAPVGFEVGAVLAQRLWQASMIVMEAAFIKRSRVLEAFPPLLAPYLFRRRGKTSQQSTLCGTLLPCPTPALDKPDDLHFAGDAV